MLKRLLPALAALACTLQAGAILNPPDQYVGFFSGYEFNEFGQNSAFAPLTSASLPAFQGFTGIKLYGSASITDEVNGNYMVAAASGTANGTLDADTAFEIRYHFISPSLPDVNWYVIAVLNTSAGQYSTEFSNGDTVNGQVAQGSYELQPKSGPSFAPAGTQLLDWRVILFLGEIDFNSSDGSTLTLDIPPTSLDLAAVGAQATDVPEPGTWLTVLAPLAAIALRRQYARRKRPNMN